MRSYLICNPEIARIGSLLFLRPWKSKPKIIAPNGREKEEILFIILFAEKGVIRGQTNLV